MRLKSITQRFSSGPTRLKDVKKSTWVIVAVCVVGLAVGPWLDSLALFGAGAAALCYLVLQLRGRTAPKKEPQETVDAEPVQLISPIPVAGGTPPSDTGELVEQMLAQGRYGLLLRPEIASNLTNDQFERAKSMLDRSMALVPEGELAIGWAGERSHGELGDEDSPRGKVVRIERFYLDRYPVTNRQFLEFVAAGGYEEMALWEPEIWPGILDFVDQTEHPGPASWTHGRYEPGLDDHPVVGVSWFETAAYSRWVGKRLPTGPEWEKAGSWPLQLSAANRPQRKYPWGDFMDRSRAKVWGTGKSTTASVYDFAEGVSVGGVYQLVGNVWEWTTGNFGAWSYPGGDVILPTPMKSIRGGAYDTYLDGQVTCQFQSGEDPICRKRNIGFRCALGVCDVTLEHPNDVTQTGTSPSVDSRVAPPCAAPPLVAAQPVAAE